MSGKVILSQNPVKTSVRLDFNGNEIDPRTKQILVPNVAESVLPPPEALVGPVQAPITQENTNSGTLSILEQIEEAKKNLASLEELKKLKIAEKKAELELLQQ